jgi:cell division protein FtsL
MGRAATAAAARHEGRSIGGDHGGSGVAHAGRGNRGSGRPRRAPRRASGRGAVRLPDRAARLSSGLAVPLRLLNAPFARALRARTARVLDALLSGRGWIALIGVLLVGIVFFNVDLLQMNRDIARDAEKASALRRENARLHRDVGRLASSERIQEAAAKLGLVLPAPGEVRYLKARPGVDARRAAKRITEPDGTLVPPAPTAAAPDQTLVPGATSVGQTPTTTPPTTTAPPTTTPPTTTAPPATPAPAATTTPPVATTPPAGTTVPPATTPPPTGAATTIAPGTTPTVPPASPTTTGQTATGLPAP